MLRILITEQTKDNKLILLKSTREVAPNPLSADLYKIKRSVLFYVIIAVSAQIPNSACWCYWTQELFVNIFSPKVFLPQWYSMHFSNCLWGWGAIVDSRQASETDINISKAWSGWEGSHIWETIFEKRPSVFLVNTFRTYKP